MGSFIWNTSSAKNSEWWKAYDKLDLQGGKITFICDDDEDMIEIIYPDGLFIDVGKPTFGDGYIITVVASNDEAGWQKPLAEINVLDKKDLASKIQDTIVQFRPSNV